MDENFQERARAGIDYLVHVARDEEKNNEEDGPGESANADADDHDLGSFD